MAEEENNVAETSQPAPQAGAASASLSSAQLAQNAAKEALLLFGQA